MSITSWKKDRTLHRYVIAFLEHWKHCSPSLLRQPLPHSHPPHSQHRDIDRSLCACECFMCSTPRAFRLNCSYSLSLHHRMPISSTATHPPIEINKCENNKIARKVWGCGKENRILRNGKGKGWWRWQSKMLFWDWDKFFWWLKTLILGGPWITKAFTFYSCTLEKLMLLKIFAIKN